MLSAEMRVKAMSTTLSLQVRIALTTALRIVLLLTFNSCQRCRGHHYQRCIDEPI
jgi:hypothetical protein